MATICVGPICITAPDELVNAAREAIFAFLQPEIEAWHAKEHAATTPAVKATARALLQRAAEGDDDAQAMVARICADREGLEAMRAAAQDATAGATGRMADYLGAPIFRTDLQRDMAHVGTYRGPLAQYVALVLRYGAIGERDADFRRAAE